MFQPLADLVVVDPPSTGDDPGLPCTAVAHGHVASLSERLGRNR